MIDSKLEYDILRSQHHADLVYMVRRRLEQGWIPNGPLIAVSDGQGHTALLQVMERLVPNPRCSGPAAA